MKSGLKRLVKKAMTRTATRPGQSEKRVQTQRRRMPRVSVSSRSHRCEKPRTERTGAAVTA